MPQSAPAEFVHREYTHHTGNIGAPGLGWQREPDPSALSTAELVASRAYAFDLETQPVEEVVAGCSESLRRCGFAVVDHVIPRGSVADVRRELSEGTEQALAAMSPEERTRPGLNGSKRDVNQLVLQPLFAQHVCHSAVVGIAQSASAVCSWEHKSILSRGRLLPTRPNFPLSVNCEGHDRIRKPVTRRTRTAERCG
jgi:hypothetical protein